MTRNLSQCRKLFRSNPKNHKSANELSIILQIEPIIEDSRHNRISYYPGKRSQTVSLFVKRKTRLFQSADRLRKEENIKMTENLYKIREFFIDDIYADNTTGITIEDAGDCFAVCSLVPENKHTNATGAVQGGAIYTLADYCFAVAANSRSIIENGRPNTVTLTANITYFRPAKPGAKLTATAKCIKSGKTACYYEVNITEEGNPEKVISSAVINGIVTDR